MEMAEMNGGIRELLSPFCNTVQYRATCVIRLPHPR